MGLLRNLSYLKEVAQTKSINKAAENLYLSKSALSSALKNLEDDFGTPLLNRSVHGVTLTNAGEMVVERASVIFNILDSMREDCGMYSEKKSPINIYTDPQFAQAILPHIINGLTVYRMNRYINTKSTNFEGILNAARDSVDNIGLFLSNKLTWNAPTDAAMYDGLIFKQIATFQLCVVTAKYSKYIPLDVKSLTYEDLKEIPQIGLVKNENSESLSTWNAEKMPAQANFVMTTDNNTVYFQAILNDIGVGYLLDIESSYGLVDRNKLRFIPLQDSPKAELWMVGNAAIEQKIMDDFFDCIRHAIK